VHPGGGGDCPASTLSETDPNLSPAPGGGDLLDSADDQPSKPENKLTLTVNITQCFAAHGFVVGSGDSWDHFRLIARPLNPATGVVSDNASTEFSVAFP
jgi:hypothetical protein